MYAGTTMPPLATGGLLAATGANTTLGVLLVVASFVIGAGLLLRDRLIRSRDQPEN